MGGTINPDEGLPAGVNADGFALSQITGELELLREAVTRFLEAKGSEALVCKAALRKLLRRPIPNRYTYITERLDRMTVRDKDTFEHDWLGAWLGTPEERTAEVRRRINALRKQFRA